jgi:hypothetical protein
VVYWWVLGAEVASDILCCVDDLGDLGTPYFAAIAPQRGTQRRVFPRQRGLLDRLLLSSHTSPPFIDNVTTTFTQYYCLSHSTLATYTLYIDTLLHSHTPSSKPINPSISGVWPVKGPSEALISAVIKNPFWPLHVAPSPFIGGLSRDPATLPPLSSYIQQLCTDSQSQLQPWQICV